MIVALAIAALELLAVVWACVLLWINAGLRGEIARLKAQASSDAASCSPEPREGGEGGSTAFE